MAAGGCPCPWWPRERDEPCGSHTAGDCGELQAMGSLELGLCSGGISPFFMIFLILDLLFWNQIFTCERGRAEGNPHGQGRARAAEIAAGPPPPRPAP